jgi:hypothetical protein
LAQDPAGVLEYPRRASLDGVTRDDGDLDDWTGLNWYLDDHVIDDPAADDLMHLRDTGWIRLTVTDTAHTEMRAAKDEATRQRLEEQLLAYPIAMGPMVLDHSLFFGSRRRGGRASPSGRVRCALADE